MIKLENVNKYFFRRRKNEIHVINNTSLEMESTGLVALLGPSGCGKTTLLNVIGGLDKVGNGSIYIDGERISRRRSGSVDRIRALKIGYIFQNYNLIDSMTVFDNVALALKMTGIRNAKEIENKVNYVLQKVGLYEYRNRYADMLSGGERQRVGIARAIVKNPAVIIADEPTGNLDSKNTLEVMNIIRSIAQEKLVILVTHEEELARFYATRIIRLRDGKVISDAENTDQDELDYRIENQIFLKDIKDHSRLKTDVYDINFYNDSGEKLKLDIVLKKGNIYIRTSEDRRVEVIDDNSGIEFIDAHYKKMDKEEMDAKAIDLSRLGTKVKRRYRSVINPFTMISKGFKALGRYSTMKKLLLAGFFMSAMFITYGVSSVFGVLNVDDDDFTGADKSYLTIVGKNISINTYLGYENNDMFSYVMPGDSRISLEVNFDNLIQFRDSQVMLDGSLSDVSKLGQSEISYGRLPENEREIVVDRMAIKQAISCYDTASMGAGHPKDFVGKTLSVKDMPDMTIVGLTDMQSPCIYTDKSLFTNLIAVASTSMDEEYELSDGDGEEIQLVDYALRTDRVKLVKGSWPEKNYQVLVSDIHKGEKGYGIGKKLKTSINGNKLEICGYYSDPYDGSELLVNNTMINYWMVKKLNNLTVCPVDKETALNQLRDEGVNVRDTYEQNRQEYISSRWDSMKSTIIMAAFILAISFIEMYLMIRASFLSRIREVGIYRAIGVKKRDICRMFSGEIIAITTIASMPGFAFMAFCLWKLSKVSFFADAFVINWPVLIICVVVIYGLNFLFGLLPVRRIIRKTPAAILARTDI